MSILWVGFRESSSAHNATDRVLDKDELRAIMGYENCRASISRTAHSAKAARVEEGTRESEYIHTGQFRLERCHD